MMRGVLLLGGICLATAEVDHVKCSINSARAVDEMLDSAMFIWASVERCGKPGHEVKCVIDVAEAAESINAMASVIVHAIDVWGGIKGDACGYAAGRFTQAAAGLAAGAAGIYEKCQNGINPKEPKNPIPRPFGKWAYCIVDVKDGLRSLMKAVQRILHAEKACKGGHHDCGATATSIIAAFAALGQYGTAAVGQCQPDPAGIDAGHLKNIACASKISEATRHASALASASTEMAAVCESSHTRLYEIDQEKAKKDKSHKNKFSNLLIGAFLPVAAVVGFLGGSRYAKLSTHQEQGFDVLQPVDTESAE
jgi:hypothetical protein